jgi:hypothetical protein
VSNGIFSRRRHHPIFKEDAAETLVSTQTLSPPSTVDLGGKLARVVLAFLLFLQGAILTLWALSWVSDELSGRGVVHVPYPAWAGAALFLILFGAAVRANWVAAAGLWLSARGQGGRIGPTKINAAWTAVVVNAALVPGLALVATLAGSLNTVDVGNLFWFVVWGGAIAAWLGFFALRPPFRWAGWRTVTKAAVACLVLLVGAGIMFRDQRIGFADSLGAYFFPGTSSSAGCVGVPDQACAARVALDADGTVAWIPEPAAFATGASGNSLVASDHQAHQTLASTDGIVIHVDSGVTSVPDEVCGSGGCAQARAVHIGHRTMVVHWGPAKGAGAVAVATWTHGGTSFFLSATDPNGPVDVAWFADVLRSVNYATP